MHPAARLYGLALQIPKMSKPIAIIAGVGPGVRSFTPGDVTLHSQWPIWQTGASIARKFAATYPVVLCSRKPDTHNPIADEINKNGGKAMGISTDVSDSKSVKAMIEKVKEVYGKDVKAAAAIFNASGPFKIAPFLELQEEDLDGSYAGSVYVSHHSFLFLRCTFRLITTWQQQQRRFQFLPSHAASFITYFSCEDWHTRPTSPLTDAHLYWGYRFTQRIR